MKQYELEFDGYWEVGTTGVADYAGIYCIYVWPPHEIDNSRLIYIGEAEDIESRVDEHIGNEDMFLRFVYHAIIENREPPASGKISEELYFSAARIEVRGDRERAEAAMINFHKPPANKEYKHNFIFPDTEIFLLGEIHRLESEFVAYNRT